MKNFRIISTFILMSIFLSSCEDLDINDNPNNVEETHPSLLLTTIAFDAAKVQGRDAMYASRMIVQTDGESSSQYYKWNRASFGSYNNLRQVTKMMEEAVRVDNNSYKAIAYFFRAHYFYNLTLTFGDIPYSEALQAETEKNYTPKYDSQQDVFKGILNELEIANNLLKSGDEIDGGSDIIYGGSVAMWRKLVNSFRLKVLMTLSKKESDATLKVKNTFASIYNSESIISNFEESAMLEFKDVVDSRYTEFNSSSYGSGLYMASTFVDALKDHQDPRLFVFADRTKSANEAGLSIDDFSAYAGGDPVGNYNDVNLLAAGGLVSKVDKRYSDDPTAEAHNLLSYSELEFILAEASVRGWISTDAKMHYENAIKANFKFYNTYAKGYEMYFTNTKAEDYIAGTNVDFGAAGTDAEKLELIITQKYFTSFLQGGWRVYFDHLRTGYPNFPYVGSNTPPKRWMYPEDEYNNNAANVSAAITNQFGSNNDNTRETTWWLK